MILSQEAWMELRAFRALAEAGATWAEIARETGHDWRTVKRYLSAGASSSPPARPGGAVVPARSIRTPTWSMPGGQAAEAQGGHDL
jgi:predicted transcriptional regulator